MTRSINGLIEEIYFDIVNEQSLKLIGMNGTTTTKEVKLSCILHYPKLAWSQDEVSKIMNNMLSTVEGLNYSDNGTYRTYSISKTPAKKLKTKVASKKATVKSKKKRIGKKAAMTKIETSKGRILSVVFKKKDNKDRKLVGKYISSSKDGYIKMKEMSTGNIRNVNGQTISYLKDSGVEHSVGR